MVGDMVRRNSYKKNIIFIFVLLFIISGISISYALLQTTLTTNMPATTVNKLTMWVTFDYQNGEEAVYYPMSNYSSECAAGANGISFGNEQATFSYNAKMLAGSKCVYKLKIKNRGTTEVKLSAIDSVFPNGASCSNISNGLFQCTYNNSTIRYELFSDSSLNTHLSPGVELGIDSNTRTMYVYFVITLTDSNGTDSQYTLNGGGFTLRYVLK